MLNLTRQAAEGFEVGAADDRGHVAFYPGNQFIDPHLDRLTEAELDARDARGQLLVHRLDQGVAGQAGAPLVLGFQEGPDVGLVDAHHVVGDLGAARLAVDQANLGKRPEDVLDLGGRRNRALQRRRGDAQRLDHQVPLVEARHELGTQVQRDRHRQPHQPQRHRRRQDRASDHAPERGGVDPFQHADQPDLGFHRFGRQPERGQDRHERERQHHRPSQGEDHRQGHRAKQLPLGPFQGEDWQVNDGDDEFAEHRRLADLDGGVADDGEFGAGSPLVREAADAILDHDDAGIDDQAEVDRPQAHEARCDASGEHDVGREQHRQGDRQGDDQTTADVAQHQEEDRHDERPAFEEVVDHRVEGLVDQVRPVVKRLDRHAGRQAGLELGHRLLDVLNDAPGILADEHHHQAGDDLPLAIARHQARADHRCQLDLRHVGHRDGDAVALDQDDRRDVSHRVRLALAPDVPRFPLVDEVAAADVAVVRPQGVEDVGQGQVVLGQFVGVQLDLERLQLPTVRVDLRDPRDSAQLVCDEPVQDRPQLHRRDPSAADLKLVDLPERRGDRPERGRAIATRDGVGGTREALADELPGLVDVGPLVENDGDHGDPEFGD